MEDKTAKGLRYKEEQFFRTILEEKTENVYEYNSPNMNFRYITEWLILLAPLTYRFLTELCNYIMIKFNLKLEGNNICKSSLCIKESWKKIHY